MTAISNPLTKALATPHSKDFPLARAKKLFFSWINATKIENALSKDQVKFLKDHFLKCFQNVYVRNAAFEKARFDFCEEASKKLQDERYLFLLERALFSITEHPDAVAVVEVIDQMTDKVAKKAVLNLFTTALTQDEPYIKRFFHRYMCKITCSVYVAGPIRYNLNNALDTALDKIPEEDLSKRWFLGFLQAEKTLQARLKVHLFYHTKNAVHFGFKVEGAHVKISPKSENILLTGTSLMRDPKPLPCKASMPSSDDHPLRPELRAFTPEHSSPILNRSPIAHPATPLNSQAPTLPIKKTEIIFSDSDSFEFANVLKLGGYNSCLLTILPPNPTDLEISELFIRSNYYQVAQDVHPVLKKGQTLDGSEVYYSPSVSILRNFQKNGYTFINPFDIDIAATFAAESDSDDALKEKIRKSLRAASLTKHDTVVVDTVNKSDKLTQLSQDVLGETEFQDHFQKVAFMYQS
jgi:hypothetical protein